MLYRTDLNFALTHSVFIAMIFLTSIKTMSNQREYFSYNYFTQNVPSLIYIPSGSLMEQVAMLLW